MAMTPYSGDLNVISKLGTTPQERGLETQQFKAKFDEGLKAFVEWFNLTHKTEFDAHLAENVTDVGGVHGLKIEEGTFTPVIVGRQTAGVNTYSSQFGKYTKINNRVFFDIHITLTAKDPTMGVDVRIDGLPFVALSNTNYRSSFSVFYSNLALRTDRPNIEALIANGWNYLYVRDTGNNLEGINILASQLMDNTTLIISGSYLVA